MIAVYQRCLANYQSRQWDMGTHVLFNETLKKKLQIEVPTVPCYSAAQDLGYECLSDCLLRAQESGSSNSVCLSDWLMMNNVNSLDFFEYEDAGTLSHVHACQVFSGPAKISGDIGLPFRICLDEYADTGICKLPSIVWSGRSTNKVPVALDHSTSISNFNEKVQAAMRSEEHTSEL